ncbi:MULTISPECIES: GMC oxidoreductase [Galbibacter]|uniref:GMC family oxidoreductase n=1 Tax=Galbibacter pacificus TaxID=2996052 RepID=A0ABT6FUR2_9FLAO|nr:GMC family oxidoreductase [Galbibacter pacificus]MDG3583356.1 GMC family oxidoreductase [Galbibacter pacificus]MDG3586837.1 GMC family oxidoreductase [Galbibacter pacificus]
MPNFNIDSTKKNTFDAIVIGSGMSGGWAAKEFTEKGLKTLVLERGRNVTHIKDYPTTNLMPWEVKDANQVSYDVKKENPIAARCYNFKEDSQHFFTKDKEQPYIQEKPFDWIRGYQTGGKSLLWARQTQRLSDFDFEGPDRDGFAVDWPIRYKDLAPWYSYVEKFVGISGEYDGLETLPDGEFLKSMGLNATEQYFKEVVAKKYNNQRHVIYGRCAHITENKEIFMKQGRAMCQTRDLCRRGCPFGGYFSSNASTLPWAQKTGNLTMQHDAVVHSVIYDDEKEKATGVRVIDAKTKEMTEYYAPVIFVNASAFNSNMILLNSKSKRFPNGLGNDNGLLGKYIAFHNYRVSISAEYDGNLDKTTTGRRPTSGYVPRFRNIHKQETDFLRGYAAGFGASRQIIQDSEGLGEALKQNLVSPKYGNWRVGSHMMGETIPKEESTLSLDTEKTDQYGIPQLRINLDYDDNDEKMIADYVEQFTEMFEAAGFTNIKAHDIPDKAPGLDIHEMGGVRMGHDPKTSLLNKWNQLHACKNVYVTDGACMTSTSTQNPSLTYMALTARACDHAIKASKKGEA